MTLSAITVEEFQALQSAVAALQTAVNNLASKQQLNHVLQLRQQEIAEITDRLDNMETQIQILQRS